MEDTNDVDYYKVLQCERTASSEELKKSYQRLILSYHPDKVNNSSDDMFLNIQKAWSVLRDPQSRKHYDATLSCQEHEELLIFESICLSDMDLDSEGNHVYQCRCGALYSFDRSETDDPIVVIPCGECSFAIQINTTK